MYPATLEGLFDAASKGTLADVNEIVCNNKININDNYNGLHILNYLLSYRLTIIDQKNEKVSLLIASGARPQFDPNVNTLILINSLSDKNLIKEIIDLIKQSKSFHNIYHQAHFDAMNGKVCDDSEVVIKEDVFGLYPIHYAIAADQDTQQWHEQFNYDLLKPLSNGYYQGLNLLYFYLDYGKYELLAQLTKQFTVEQRFKLLLSHPENPIHSNFRLSFAMMYLNHLKINYTAERMLPHLKLSTLIHGFYPNQCLNLLKLTILEQEDNIYGATFAWLLTTVDLFDELKELSQNLSPEQCVELLKSAPTNPNNVFYGTRLGWNIAIHFRITLLEQLTRDISAEDLFDLLMCAPLHAQNKNYKMSLAWLLVYNGGNSNYLQKSISLSVKQRFELLNSSPQNPKERDFNVNLASLLISIKEYDLLKKFMKGMSPEQIFELLKSIPLNSLHPRYRSTIPSTLIACGRYDVLMDVIVTLNEEQILLLLLNSQDKSEKSSTDFLTLINFYAQTNSDFLINFLERFNSDKFYEIMYKAIQKNKDSSNSICHILIQKITLRLNVLLKQSLVINKQHAQEIAEEIKGLLAYIRECWPYFSASNNFAHKCYEIIGMTISNACHSPYKLLFCNAFANDPNYEHISKVNSTFALEGFGHYLRIISADLGQALLLGIDFAQAKADIVNNNTALKPPPILTECEQTITPEISITSSDEIAHLKQQILSLQKDNEMLRKAALEKDQQPKIVGNDPRLFGQTAAKQLPKVVSGPVTECDEPPRLQ